MNSEEVNQLRKLCGNSAYIRSNFSKHQIPLDRLVYLSKFDSERNKFIVHYNIITDSGAPKEATDLVGYEDLNLRLSQQSINSIALKGNRVERSDDYKDKCIIQLLDDDKSIYLSTALRSLLVVAPGDFVGLSIDSESKKLMIFKCMKPNEGFEVGGNGRIKSSADFRDLQNTFDMYLLGVELEPFIDPTDFPKYLFYTIYNYEERNNLDKKSKKQQKKDLKSPFTFNEALIRAEERVIRGGEIIIEDPNF